MVKLIYIFHIIFIVSFCQLNSNELTKKDLFNIQDSLATCILMAANKQLKVEDNPYDKLELNKIISHLEIVIEDDKYFFYMLVSKINNIFKIELFLDTYYEFITDDKIINNKKFYPNLQYSDVFLNYFFLYTYKCTYQSPNFTYLTYEPLVFYIQLLNDEILILNNAEIGLDSVNIDKTKSFFTNEYCY